MERMDQTRERGTIREGGSQAGGGRHHLRLERVSTADTSSWRRESLRLSLITLLCAVCFSLFSFPALATFDIYPEFHSLTEGESQNFDSSQQIDSEYESDVVAYLKPLEWDPRYFERAIAFDFTLGSLSNSIFLDQTRFKASKRIFTQTDFRVTYFIQRDLDVDQSHLILELVHEPLPHAFPGFRISVYGEPSFLKRESDVGLALLFAPSDRHEIRVFNTWVDLVRDRHSSEPDKFVEGYEPLSYGFVGRCVGCLGQDWLEYYFRRESPTRWLFPQTDSEYTYQNLTVGGATRISFPGSTWMNNLRGQYSRKKEGTLPNSPASPVAERSLTRDLVEVLGSTEIPAGGFLGSHAIVEPGLGWFQRLWKAGDGSSLDQRNLLPFAWLRLAGAQRGPEKFDRISIGYEVTFFDSDGPSSPLASPELKEWAVEHRLNFRYEFALDDNALLSLFVSSDLDALIRGNGGAFEGGNGMIRVYF